MGRPKGSKNKPKLLNPGIPTPAETPAPPAEGEVVKKRRGRPPGSKNKKPEAPEPTRPPTPQPVTPAAPAGSPMAAPAPAAQEGAGVPPYTLQDLLSEKLQPFEDAIAPLAEAASAKRKAYFASRAVPGVAYRRQVLRTFIDFLEIDPRTLS